MTLNFRYHNRQMMSTDAKLVPRPATIGSVARVAGVSPMTVSRVLNGREGAGAETRQRVLEAARQLDYRPNSFAKNLRNNRSMIVGILVPDIVNPFFPEIIRGAELAARPAGYTLLSCNVVEDPAREEEVLGMLREKRVDGVIICSSRLEQKRLVRAVEGHRAVVIINRTVPKRVAGTIEIDYRAGIEALVEDLVVRGRRRFAFAAGPASSHSGQRRREGLQAVLARHGLGLGLDVPGAPDLGGGNQAGQAVLERIGEIDAVICYNDLIAVGVMNVLRSAGINVPDQVAVTGCDDIMVAALVTPALTTLRVEKQELGQLAMRMLLDRIENRNAQHSILIEPDVIQRASS